MSQTRWIIPAILMACSSSPRPPDIANSTSVSKLAQARVFERGVGAPRDYSRAAEVYTSLCEEGAGQLQACFALIDAIQNGRGVAVDWQRIQSLTTEMCRRGDATACVIKAFTNRALDLAMQQPAKPSDADKSRLEADFKRMEQACESGDGHACAIVASFEGGDGGEAQRIRHEKYLAACRAGLVHACREVAQELASCGEPEVEDIGACEAPLMADEAATRLLKECTAGDAIACAGIPSRRISPADLCRAHDYEACADLGCMGDDTAGALARDHGVTNPNCYVAHRRAHVAWRKTQIGFPPIVGARREPIGARPTKPFDAIRFTHHGGRDGKGWPRYDVYNINDQPLLELRLCAYAYDDGGNQIARVETDLAPLPLAANAIMTLDLDRGTVSDLPKQTATVELDYQQVRFANAPASIDATRCPAQRPQGESRVYGW